MYVVAKDKTIEDFLDNGYQYKETQTDEKDESGIKQSELKSVVYKEILQPEDGYLVNQLVGFYSLNANKLCKDKNVREAYKKAGIEFICINRKYQLNITDEVKELFRHWRLEIDFFDEKPSPYVTFGGGEIPGYGSTSVLEKYAKDEIERLVSLGLIENE